MSRYDIEGEVLAPQFQTETDLPDHARRFGHNMRKYGYRATVPRRYLREQQSVFKERAQPVHEFMFHEDWTDIETAMIQAVQLGKMKPWHVLAYKYENVVNKGNYPRYDLRLMGMLVFTREADWLMFKMCL